MGKTDKSICSTCVMIRNGYCDGEHNITGTCEWYKRMTNCDKYFRFATSAEIGEFMNRIVRDDGCATAHVEGTDIYVDDWEIWLQQEVEE